MGIKLIEGKSEIKHPDNNIKIYMLIIMASFFDFNLFLIGTYYLPIKYGNVSKSLNVRLRSILTISCALGCYYLLRIPILKHQLFSLLIILLCLISILVSEFLYEQFNITFVFALILNFIVYFLNACLDIVEKYLLEYDYLNPFKIIMLEGIFGLIISIPFCFIAYPLEEIIKVSEETINLIILIVFLLIYFFTSVGRNIYRIITNKLFSPMTRTLTDCILDPLLIVYYYFCENDFISGTQKSLYYFIINLVISLIIVICSCIYNEIFVIFCFKLEHDTHREISKRATIKIRDSNELESDGNSSQSNRTDDNESSEQQSN